MVCVAVDHGEDRVGERDHERGLGSQDPVHLAQHPAEVLDVVQGAGGHHEIDRCARGEAEVAELAEVELDADPFASAAARPAEMRAGSWSTAIALAPARARANAFTSGAMPSSITRLAETSPQSRSSPSWGTLGP